jgi:hypothetical protein
MSKKMNNEQTTPQEIEKPNTTTEKSIKVWSESSNKWRYIPKDPAYFKIKYHEYVRPKSCPFCGSIINTQMLRHNRTQKCKLVRAGIANAVGQIENAIASVIKEPS